MKLIIKLLVRALAVFLTAYLLSGVQVENLLTALIVAVVLGLINTFLKPIIMLFALPITLLTLGLFSLVINVLLVMLADYLIEGFAIVDFWWAAAFAVVL